MLDNIAALKIQGFFSSYRLNKQATLQQLISESPHSQLLQALDLRFQCMKAVAAAKFPINKPLEDKEQVARVIHSVTELAREKGVTNLHAVAELFQYNIMLSTAIQSPYYNLIWRKSHHGERDIQKLINHAYAQLRDLVISNNLPLRCPAENHFCTPADVLALARDIIQHASHTIIERLANPTDPELGAMSQRQFAEVIEKMLANYMTPSELAHSKENIDLFTQNIAACSMC